MRDNDKISYNSTQKTSISTDDINKIGIFSWTNICSSCLFPVANVWTFIYIENTFLLVLLIFKYQSSNTSLGSSNALLCCFVIYAWQHFVAYIHFFYSFLIHEINSFYGGKMYLPILNNAWFDVQHVIQKSRH